MIYLPFTNHPIYGGYDLDDEDRERFSTSYVWYHLIRVVFISDISRSMLRLVASH